MEHDKYFQLICKGKNDARWGINKNMEESSVSRENIEKIHALKLNYVCEIALKKDNAGKILEYHFQEDITGNTELRFSQYGKGPFCRFSIPNGYSGKSGVYFMFEDSALRYIGECANLATRFNLGYGIIEARNCLHDGQQTNCRINHLILEKIKDQGRILLYFYETSDRKHLETKLISHYHPLWNKTHTNCLHPQSISLKENSKGRTQTEKSNHVGKYEPLSSLLKTCKKTELLLTFPEIEALLGFTLPPSAYKYQTWWANDTTHSQARAWLNANWKVVHVNFGKSVKFSTDIVKI